MIGEFLGKDGHISTPKTRAVFARQFTYDTFKIREMPQHIISKDYQRKEDTDGS